MTDQDYMALALDLAQKGAGWTSPNPMVGAVLVKQGRIIGQGYHARWGDLHAERAALAACREDPAGSTLYVTLEPCCHQGKHPLHPGHSGGRHHPGGGGLRGPQPPGGRPGPGPASGPGGPGDRGGAGGGMPGPEPRVLSLHPDRPALCGAQVRHDPGWQAGGLHRGLPVDHRGGRPPPRPHPARPLPVHSGGGGHGAGRRPPAHLPDGGGAEPPAPGL